MTSEVESAIDEVRQAFPGHEVDAEPEPDGGAVVFVRDLPIGAQYAPSRSWIGFRIGFQYPYEDIYPHYMDPGVQRADGQPLGEGFHQQRPWRGSPATMISRRSNHRDPALETAAIKLAKVIQWMEQR